MDLEPYLQAAAVLHVFTIATLNPLRDAPPVPPGAMLRASTAAPGYLRERGRSLKSDERHRALSAIEKRERALAILERNPKRIMTDTQRFFETLLKGTDIALQSLSVAELRALKEANEWAHRLSASQFKNRDLEFAIENAEAIAAFQHLPPERFVGRADIIGRLREFVGLSPAGIIGKFSTLIRGEQRVLVIEGVGGIGKTATVGQFLMRDRNDGDGPLFPFAYVPCDNNDLDLRQPQTLLVEAARQFARFVRLSRSVAGSTAAIKDFEDQYDRFVQRVTYYDDLTTTLGSRRGDYLTQEARITRRRSSSGGLAQDFASLATAASRALARSGQALPPALLVIDTFEEVEYQAQEHLLPLLTTLEQVLEGSQQFKLIIAGRGPISDLGLSVGQTRIAMTELDEASAVELLVKESGAPRDQLHGIVRQIGGSPLNLRLVARLLSEEPVESADLRDVRTRRFGVLRLAPELITGQLYRRLLDRIHDDRVKRLAHPGMILRRVTPDIIRVVLASVTDLGTLTATQVDELFSELMKEHTLVRLDDDRSLRYREDVRTPVVRLLALDEPLLSRRVHEAAIGFYRSFKDPVSVAEHVYHRLLLGGDTSEIDTVWVPAAERYLHTALAELPPEGRVWLAERMSIRLPEELYRQAHTAAWERIVGPRALAVLESRSSEDALSLLLQRSDRTPDSPLFAIQSRLLVSTGDLVGAERLLAAALVGYPAFGNPGRRAELLWLAAQVARRIGNNAEADERLDQLIEFSPAVRSRLPLVQALASRLHHAASGWTGAPDLQQSLVRALLALDPDEIYREADIVRTAYARLPLDVAPAARRVLAQIGSSLSMVLVREQLNFDVTRVQALRDFAAGTAGQAGAEWLGASVVGMFSSGTVQTSDLLKLVDVALSVLTDPQAEQASEGIYAAKIVWWLLQLEPGDLGSATLAGIDEYRAEWELAGPSVAFA
jgi:hypothetical protein